MGILWRSLGGGGGSTGSVAYDDLLNCSEVFDNDSSHDAAVLGGPILPFYFMLLALSLGSLTLYSQDELLSNVPYASKLFILGVGLGLLHSFTGEDHELGVLGDSFDLWTSLDPHLIATIFLPALIFSDAMKLDIHMLQRCLSQCSLLAGPGVILTASLLAICCHLITGWTWHQCFLFGSTLSATDPVAVVTLMEPSGAPHKLTMIMGGESHMGDLTMLILFEVFLNLSLHAQYTSTGLASYIVRMALGGLAFGVALGLVAYLMIRYNSDRTSVRSTMVQITTTVVLAYTSFLFAEYTFDSNGVIATFASALVIATFAWPLFVSRATLNNVWSMIEFMGNTLIFVLVGLKIGSTLLRGDFVASGYDVGIGILLYVALMGSRTLMVVILYPLLTRLGYGLKRTEGVVIAWGGLRGAVALTLAVIAKGEISASGSKEDTQYGQRFLFLISIVVFLTLLINGSTCVRLLGSLGLLRQPQVKRQLFEYVDRRFEREAHESFAKVQGGSKYNRFDHDVVVRHVSSLAIKGQREQGTTGPTQKVEVKKVPKKTRFPHKVKVKVLKRDKRYNSIQKKQSSDSGYSSSRTRTGRASFEERTVRRDGSIGQAMVLELPKRTKTPAELFQERFNPTSVANDFKLTSHVRELFYSALSAAYWEQINKGVIPKGSNTSRLLLSSVESALDHPDQPLMDFARLHLPFTDDKYKRPRHVRILDRISSLGVLPKRWMHWVTQYVHSVAIERGVYLASCMIEAHESARAQLKEFVGPGMRRGPEFQVVVSESLAQVQRAESFLELARASDGDIVELVQNRKVASIVLNNQKWFADRMRSQGVLDGAAHYELLLHIRMDAQRLQRMHRRGSISGNAVSDSASDN